MTLPLFKLCDILIDSVALWPWVWGDLWGFVLACQHCLSITMRHGLNLDSVRSLENSAVEAAYLAGYAYRTRICWVYIRFLVLRHFMPIFSLLCDNGFLLLFLSMSLKDIYSICYADFMPDSYTLGPLCAAFLKPECDSSNLEILTFTR